MLKRIRKNHHDSLSVEDKTRITDKNEFESINPPKKLKIINIPNNELIKEGFYAGIGWAFGVTVGFVLISILIVFILRNLGGLPVIGSWIADVVEETQNQLLRRTPVFSN